MNSFTSNTFAEGHHFSSRDLHCLDWRILEATQRSFVTLTCHPTCPCVHHWGWHVSDRRRALGQDLGKTMKQSLPSCRELLGRSYLLPLAARLLLNVMMVFITQTLCPSKNDVRSQILLKHVQNRLAKIRILKRGRKIRSRLEVDEQDIWARLQAT